MSNPIRFSGVIVTLVSCYEVPLHSGRQFGIRFSAKRFEISRGEEFLPISQAEIVQIARVCRLLVVSVHLVIDRHSPPADWNGISRIAPIDVRSREPSHNR
jgi:hypothetical protein